MKCIRSFEKTYRAWQTPFARSLSCICPSVLRRCRHVAKASKECGVAIKDMLGKGFLTRLLEREVEKRVASDA